MSRITLTLDKTLNAALRARALADGGRSRSSVARAALVAYLASRKKIHEARAQDLQSQAPDPAPSE